MATAQGPRYCIVGAGAAGLAVARRFKAQRLDFDLLEASDEVGGLWNHGRSHSVLYDTARLISSKPLSQFPGFPMPAEWPDYLKHEQALDYLQRFADHFALGDHIRFATPVERAEPNDAGWLVQPKNAEPRHYQGLIVASGFTREPRWPNIPGEFTGTSLHAAQFRRAERFNGRRVLVVGAGNSGCDIAVELSRRASRTLISMRRGYHVIPKYLYGQPADQFAELGHRLHLPGPLRRLASKLAVRVAVGKLQHLGLPRPDHRLFETHPIINSCFTDCVAHGDIEPRPDVERLEDDCVLFTDGSSERLDTVIYATGYRRTVPFLTPKVLDLEATDAADALDLYLVHRTHPNLAVLGQVQPDSGVWPLFDLQALLLARLFSARANGDAAADWFAREAPVLHRRAVDSGIRYLDSPRHCFEVEHGRYRGVLRKVAKRLDR